MSKRSLSPDDANDSDAKRQKSGRVCDSDAEFEPMNNLSSSNEDQQSHDAEGEEFLQGLPTRQSICLSTHHYARCGLQRSIAIILRHDGFESVSPEALESFTEMVETYLRSVIEETKRLSVASRRDNPIPLDFETMMKRYSLPLSALKPHIKYSASIKPAPPVYLDASLADSNGSCSLPLLSEELSGQSDKNSKRYIPSSFPDFPSTHTYRFTPQEDARHRDAKGIREEAARAARQGEDALRRLVRASKMRKQKEVKSLVERDSQGKERFRLWESTMRRFMGNDDRGERADQVEIADHSMIVNGDAAFSRQEVSRLNKRSGPLSHHAS